MTRASDFVELRGGLILPVLVISLAVSLEAKGFLLLQGEDGRLVIRSRQGECQLTDDERDLVKNNRDHLLAVVAYCETTSQRDIGSQSVSQDKHARHRTPHNK